MNFILKKPNKGFTLLEVLVAVVILAISLTALLKSTQSDIHTTNFLLEKNIAQWIAQNTLDSLSIHLYDSNPSRQQSQSKTVTMLNRTFRVEIKFNKALLPKLYNTQVTVYQNDKLLAEMSGVFHEK